MSAATSSDLAARYGLRLDVSEVDSNPNMADMPEGSTHWECTLSDVDNDSHYVTFVFSQGPAIEGEPDLYSVLSCLASDANMWEAGELHDFESYCASFGYDNDSIKAFREYERTRDLIRRQTADLRYTLSDHDGRYFALLNDEAVQ